MRKGFLTSLAALLTSGGLALASPPGPIAQISFEDGDHADHVVQAGGIPGVAPAPIQAENCAPTILPGSSFAGEAPCGPPGDMWFDAEYLMWWVKDAHLPVLATTGPVDGGGLLGAPGTKIVLGGNDEEQGIFSGGRFGAGMWLDDCHTVGLEADYLFLGPRGDHLSVSSDGSANSILLARPFFDTGINAPNSDIFALPGEASGRLDVRTETFLQGAEANLLCNVCCGCNGRVDLLGGFRWMQLREDVDIHEHALIICNCPNPFPVTGGNTLDTYDLFNTHNNFYGGNLGARAEFWRGCWFVRVLGQVALGDNHESANINGSTIITTPGGATTFRPAGLLAVNGNIGHYERNVFAVIPEVGLTLGYQLTEHMRLFVGYSFLYWSNVLRAGDQIPLASNGFRAGSSILFNPNAAGAVGYTFHHTDFWAQGVNFGVEFRY